MQIICMNRGNKTATPRSDLSGYSHVCIVIKEEIAVPKDDNAEDLDNVMLI